jgi:hypothetical protein
MLTYWFETRDRRGIEVKVEKPKPQPEDFYSLTGILL